MTNERTEKQQAELLGLVRLLMREAGQLRARLEKLEEKADGLVQYLAELERRLSADRKEQVNLPPHPAPHRPRIPSASKLQLRLLAEKGTDDLEIHFLADGSASVRLDRGKDFGLPPLLAALLLILIVDNSQSDDDKVGWKTWGEVAILLGKKANKTFKQRTISQLVYRLRDALTICGGVNPYLVQTDKTLGARLAFKRTTKAVIVKESM